MVHHRTVAIAFNVSFKVRPWATESNLADFLARNSPFLETCESFLKLRHVAAVNHVDKGIAQRSLSLEVDWQIHKVVLVCKALIVKHLQELERV